MPIDMLVLDSGEWVLGEELAAQPWHVLIYRQRGSPANELHLWLPSENARRSKEYAFKRFWPHEGIRWCIETPAMVTRRPLAERVRFTSPDGQVRWAYHADRSRGLGDLSESELRGLLGRSVEGPYVMTGAR